MTARNLRKVQYGIESQATPHYPPGLWLDRQYLKITVREDSGALFEAFRPESFVVAEGDLWPLE